MNKIFIDIISILMVPVMFLCLLPLIIMSFCMMFLDKHNEALANKIAAKLLKLSWNKG